MSSTQILERAAAGPTTRLGSQVVAANVRRLRRAASWSQDDARARLTEVTDGRLDWSRATWSAAERSVDGIRQRAFTADEIVALAEVFGVEVGELFRGHTGTRPCPTCRGTGRVVEERRP